jgi:chromosome partitioning protein
MTATVVATAMQKGGVGKTTTTINLAGAASAQGRRVLVVDLDPQGNTTDSLADTLGRTWSIADAIKPSNPVPIREVIVPGIWEGVWLAPVTSTEALTTASDLISVSQRGRCHRLVEALRPVADDYDLVLIDNAPALGTLLLNALTAAHLVLVVMEADRWSETGLVELRTTIDGVRQYDNSGLGYAGILISKWRGTKDENAKLAEIAEYFPEAPLLEDTIPLWASVKTTINRGVRLDQSTEPRLRVLGETYGRVVTRLLSREPAAA